MNPLFFFSLSNGIENDMIFMSILDPLGAAAGSTEAGGGGQVAVRMVVDVVVVGVGRRVVVHPGSLWAVWVEPCHYSHPCIQQLCVLSHLTFSPCKHALLSLQTPPFLSFLSLVERKEKIKNINKKNPANTPFFSLSPNSLLSSLSFLPGRKKRKEKKKKDEKMENILEDVPSGTAHETRQRLCETFVNSHKANLWCRYIQTGLQLCFAGFFSHFAYFSPFSSFLCFGPTTLFLSP